MAGRKAVDMTGQKFGRLTVLAKALAGPRHAVWLCVCYCGEMREVERTALVRGRQVSCGCHSREQSAKRCAAGLRSH